MKYDERTPDHELQFLIEKAYPSKVDEHYRHDPWGNGKQSDDEDDPEGEQWTRWSMTDCDNWDGVRNDED